MSIMRPLEGTLFSITGESVGPIQRSIFGSRIAALGGRVKPLRQENISSEPIDENLTHILLIDADPYMTKDSLKRKLNVSDISFEKVSLVTPEWLKSCEMRKVLVDANETESFCFKFSRKRSASDITETTLSKEECASESPRNQNASLQSTLPTHSASSIFSSFSNYPEVSLVMEDDMQLIQTQLSPGWHTNKSNTLMFRLHEDHTMFKSPTPVCFYGFDMDGTIITTKSGKSFPTSATDWRFLNGNIQRKYIQRLHEEGNYIAIISNQGGIKDGFNCAAAVQIRTKVDEIIRQLGVPIDFICAIGKDISIYRKPAPGMWDFLSSIRCPNFNRSESIFVGDAAGRESSSSTKKDFSDSDLKLALNLNVKFQTPEQFFSHMQNQKIPTPIDMRLSSMRSGDPIILDIFSCDKCGSQEIVLLVGVAASGKSTLARRFDPTQYSIVNQDKLKTIENCIKKAKEIISSQERKSVIVDNTNVTKETRKKWVELATLHRIPIRCIFIKMSKEENQQLNAFRFLDFNTSPEDRRFIPQVSDYLQS